MEEKIKGLIDDGPYKITSVNWTSVNWGNIYVAKPEWKEKEDYKGIYTLCIEKWDREWPIVGIKKDTSLETDVEKEINDILSSKGFKKIKGFLAYIPIPDWKYGDLKTYYLGGPSKSESYCGIFI